MIAVWCRKRRSDFMGDERRSRFYLREWAIRVVGDVGRSLFDLRE